MSATRAREASARSVKIAGPGCSWLVWERPRWLGSGRASRAGDQDAEAPLTPSERGEGRARARLRASPFDHEPAGHHNVFRATTRPSATPAESFMKIALADCELIAQEFLDHSRPRVSTSRAPTAG